jgi:hypothetical protein
VPGDIYTSCPSAGLFLFPFRNLKAKQSVFILQRLSFLLLPLRKLIYVISLVNQMRVMESMRWYLESQKKTLTEEQKGLKKKWVGYQAKS